MTQQKIAIGTLNLWRYYEWPARFDVIVAALKEASLDVVCLQEVQLNQSFSSLSQSRQIADALGYAYHSFSPTMKKVRQIGKDGAMNQEVTHGLAVLSRLPIVDSEGIILPKQDHDPEFRGIQIVKVKAGDVLLDVCNVHFSNADDLAAQHLKDTVALLAQRELEPVIAGDFNIFNLDAHSLPAEYVLSTEVSDYISYPKDEATLDYITSPKKYAMQKVACLPQVVSDHRIVVAALAI